jgi:hypothetical protein
MTSPVLKLVLKTVVNTKSFRYLHGYIYRTCFHEQEWEEAHDNFIEFEDYETRLHRLRSELPLLDIPNNRDLTSKIRLMERRKRKWLAIMHGLTRLIEKRA